MFVQHRQTQLIHGVLPVSLYKDAIEQEEDLYDEWTQWPLLSSDGSVAALISMMSNHKVMQLLTSHSEMRTDPTHHLSCRSRGGLSLPTFRASKKQFWTIARRFVSVSLDDDYFRIPDVVLTFPPSRRND